MVVLQKFRFLLFLLLISFPACTDIGFQQLYSGPKGIDFKKGAFVVNYLMAPVSKDQNKKLTDIILEFLHDMSRDSVIHVESLKISNDINSGLIDSLRKYPSYTYLFNVTLHPEGKRTNDITVKPSDFNHDADSMEYLDNKATAEITIFDIRAGTQIYKQKIIATEVVSADDLQEKGSVFTRSSENLMKNALVRGLRDLRRHSKF